MTTKRRRIEIVASERITVRFGSLVCPVCLTDTQLLTIDQSTELLQVQAQSIHEWLNNGSVHGVKTPAGEQRICKTSLFR